MPKCPTKPLGKKIFLLTKLKDFLALFLYKQIERYRNPKKNFCLYLFTIFPENLFDDAHFNSLVKICC
jgi:hypothetical protein